MVRTILIWVVVFSGGALGLFSAAGAHAQTVSRVKDHPPTLAPLASEAHGRVKVEADGSMGRQWPGAYFETAFTGDQAFFRIGAGEVSLRVRVDDQDVGALVRPAPGFYRVTAPGPGAHRLRIDVVSESQAGPSWFGGFFVERTGAAAPLAHRAREIEFIGDSHTVGYGNTSDTRACSDAEIWDRTDTSRGIAPLAAVHYDADYEVNAISGRGVVRNYGGFAADTLPQAYPFVLFDKRAPAREPEWRPQVIVIALGTNDFSTPLHPGEKWKTREALHADYEATYVRFVQMLRTRNPHAYVVLWATDLADGEIEAEVSRVADRLHAAGDARVGYVPVNGLAFTACNYHPSLADDRKIADAIIAHLDTHSDAWAP
jgi:lysophospholipase L1-like esterase